MYLNPNVKRIFFYYKITFHYFLFVILKQDYETYFLLKKTTNVMCSVSANVKVLRLVNLLLKHISYNNYVECGVCKTYICYKHVFTFPLGDVIDIKINLVKT